MKSKPKRVFGIGLGIVAVCLIAGEVVARTKLGLGDPPIYVADPQIEYMIKPGVYHRFGNLVSFNRYSMRADEFPQHKVDKRELRVMVIGDSIVYGGAQLDQSQIAVSLLEKDLTAKLHRPVTVGNISAGSWGPPNQLAYVKRFGLFDADAVVIVGSGQVRLAELNRVMQYRL
ncbi:hypothetical protein B1R32_1021 [Abditibacterium utsteinense]|uniref:GDSL-like Lipase/Acylhydrolase family protein n=1 Tax=Abditibacterium utsteinense TaxID=1960156 RepID=A0A2S8SW23_9BACT|nr:hypothetical protein [Abditibacterium utsteinense]PQV64995.1 hypothetical protein B1R32_1021 [Abditibacterium utsteinense]